MSTVDDNPSLRCCRQKRCADARARTVHDPNGDKRRIRFPAWAITPNGMCRVCTQLTHRAIDQLPADYFELGELLGKTYSTIEPPTGGTRELPVPIRLNIEALQAAILDEAERWAEAVTNEHTAEYEQAGARSNRITAAATVLSARFDQLLALPQIQQIRLDPTDECLSGADSVIYPMESGLDGALQLLALHEQVTAIAGRTHRAHKLWAFCRSCHRLALEHPEGANYVECRRCGERMPYDEYDDMSRLLAQRHERDPIDRPKRPHRPAPPDQPITWADDTVHVRIDRRSNMMLSYVRRHLGEKGSAA